MSQFPGTRVHNVRPTSYPLFAWRWRIRFREEPLTRRRHFGSPVGCIAGFRFEIQPVQKRGHPLLYEDNMLLLTLDPLHVYVA
jgi:hypothetical protein